MSLLEQLMATVKPISPSHKNCMTASQEVLEFRTVGFRIPRQTGKTEEIIKFVNAHPGLCIVVVYDNCAVTQISGKLPASTLITNATTFGQRANSVAEHEDNADFAKIKYLLIDDATHTLGNGALSLDNLGYWVAATLPDDAIVVLVG